MGAEAPTGVEPIRTEAQRKEGRDAIKALSVEQRQHALRGFTKRIFDDVSQPENLNKLTDTGKGLEKFADPIPDDPQKRSQLDIAVSEFPPVDDQSSDEDIKLQSDGWKARVNGLLGLTNLSPDDYPGQKTLIEDAQDALDLLGEKGSDGGGLMIRLSNTEAYTIPAWYQRVKDGKITPDQEQAALWAFEKPAPPAPELTADQVIEDKIKELTQIDKPTKEQAQALLRLGVAAMANGHFGAEIKQQALAYAKDNKLLTDVDGALEKLQRKIDGRTEEEKQTYGELSKHIADLGKDAQKALEKADGNTLDVLVRNIKTRDAAENKKVFALIFGQDVNRKDLEEFFDPNNRQRLEQQLKDGSTEISGTLLVMLLALGIDLGSSVMTPTT